MHRGQLPCTLALRFLHFQGRNVLGDHWAALVSSLAGVLTKAARGSSRDDSAWQWSFSDLLDARRAWQSAVSGAKVAHGWSPRHGALPVQALLDEPDHDRRGEEVPWEMLSPEVLHLTGALHQEWELLSDPEQDGTLAVVEDRAGKVFRIAAAEGEEPRALTLFPGRLLPRRLPGPRCFYCGRTGHHPADCPSRLLGPEVHGLSHVGYLSLPELSLHYQKAFADEGRLVQLLRDSTDPSGIRADPPLQAYLAYYDLTRTYQLRTLLYLAYLQMDGWPGIGPLGRAKPTPGNTLHLALDCLRVGNLSQAEGLLRTLEGVDGKDRFFVAVGLAFVALEQGDRGRMKPHLDQARAIAALPEQRTYAALLRSRFMELYGGEAGTPLAVSAALDAAGRCAEVEYRVFQLSARDGLADDALGQLRSLIRRHREYFLVALLDPELAKICGPVEGVLASLLQDSLERGKLAFDQVKEEAAALRDWIGEGERTLDSVLAGVANLEKRAKRESFLGFDDLSDAAGKLHDVCREVRERGVERLLRSLDSVRGRRALLSKRWLDYPCKRFYKRYPSQLHQMTELERRASALILANCTPGFREAEQLLQRANEQALVLESQWPEMAWLWNSLEFARRFLSRLVLAEAVALVLALLVVPMVSPLLAGKEGLLAIAGFRRLAFFALVIFLAPSSALLMALLPVPKVKVLRPGADP